MFGYNGKLLSVNLSKDQVFRVEDLDKTVARMYLGGSSLGARVLKEMDWMVDPFDPKSKLVFAVGPLNGTSAPSSSRYVVCAKSPLTGIWGEAHAAGYWGTELKLAGYDGIVIEGKAEKPVYLLIQHGKAEIKDAKHLWGKNTDETQGILKKEHGDEKLRIACIGPAGEKLSSISGIINDQGRAAARCGLGAVMGSKSLKAIAVRGSGKLQIAEKERFHEFVKELRQMMVKTPGRAGLYNYGTAGATDALHNVGDVPIYNFRKNSWPEGIHKLTGQAIAKTILFKHSSCRTCPLACEKIIHIKDGSYAGMTGRAPEYEACIGFGSLCLNDNLKAVVKANDLCNKYGLDVISTSSTIAFAMECYEKGLLTKNDTDGLELTWGNHKAMVEIVEKIGKREGIGNLLAEGSKRAAEKIRGQSKQFVMHVKGLEVPMHDPRAFSSWVAAFSTSNRGACHIYAPAYWIERGMTFPGIGLDKPLDRHASEGKGRLVKIFQDFCEVLESLVICKFSLYANIRSSHIIKLLNLSTGWDIDVNELMKIGERAFNLKRLINVRLGISRKDDVLPKRFFDVSRDDAKKWRCPNVSKIMDDYYKSRGWTEEGIPKEEKLKELSLCD